MNAEQIERMNELATVTLDAEKRLSQAVQMIKSGNIECALTDIEIALGVAKRVMNELRGN
jgi:ABC-type amino acid transport substrate-binding protein